MEKEKYMTSNMLPSWNEGTTRQAIVDFVTSTTQKGPNFVDSANRIATFDNDGTLWVEQPTPPQLDFFLRTWAREAQENPSLRGQQPYKAIIEKDRAFFIAALVEQKPEVLMTLEQAIGRSWTGTTPEQFDSQVREFFTTTRDAKFGVIYSELVYQPMLELFDFLKQHEYRVFVCSAGGRDFMRVIAEDTWGIFKENVIGSAPEYEYKDGKLVRQDKVLGRLALGPGKPEHIFARTGRLPMFAGGNGDVDIEMLEAAQFALLIVHDDDEREYAYTAGAEKSLAAAAKHGWTMVSMKNDWSTVFKRDPRRVS